MKTVIQTREFINGKYKGVVFEKIIVCLDDSDVRNAKGTKEGSEGGYKFKVLNVRVVEDFDPIIYARRAKPINFDYLLGSV